MRMFHVGRRGWTDIPVPLAVRDHVRCPCCDHYRADTFEARAYGVSKHLPGPARLVEYFERPTDTRPTFPMLCAHCWRRLPAAARRKYSRIV